MTAEDFKTEVCELPKLLAYLIEDARGFVMSDPEIAHNYSQEKQWEKRRDGIVEPYLVEKDFSATVGGAEATFRRTGRLERSFQLSRERRPVKQYMHEFTTSTFRTYSHKKQESIRLESPRRAKHGHASHSLEFVRSRSEPIFEPFPYLARKAPPRKLPDVPHVKLAEPAPEEPGSPGS
jgi:hypothetical protein